jgi:peptidoglycan DL-endopeptidase CwlO
VRRAATLTAALLASLAAATSAGAAGRPGGACPRALPGTPARVACAAQSSFGRRAVRAALGQLGAPYAWGGATPAGFDCSGFTRWVYGRLGVDLPHSSYAQWASGRRVWGPPRPGDLVFFAGLSHVGIALGGGRFVHAPNSGSTVRVDSLSADWYAATYDGAVRPAPPAPLVSLPVRHAWRRPLVRASQLG